MTGQDAKRCFLGMPGYGDMSMGAARGFYRSTRGSQAKIPIKQDLCVQNGSLLAQNFNGLWCRALTRCERDGLHYFAMIHSDIEPQDYWLDILIEELEEKGLDVLSAAVPIKDSKGLTSTAVARDDGDTWRPKARVTMHELFQLPETFTSEDVGGPLLLNTGLWVCKFDMDWCRKVHFEINDRIVYNAEKKLYFSQVEPEDWHFSRQLHDLGLKIGCTRKVKLMHKGSGTFSNVSPWGTDKIDENYTQETIVPPRKVDEFRFPFDVDGWLTETEGRALYDLCKGKHVLEVGSYCGKSTICIAQGADAVISVDPHDGRATPNPKDTYQEFIDNLNQWEISDKVYPHRGTLGDGPVSSYDIIVIDGDHSEDAVRGDIDLSLPQLKEDGVLIFHDYREQPGEHDGRWDPGVTDAVNEFLQNGAELIERHGTLAVVKPPAKALLEA